MIEYECIKPFNVLIYDTETDSYIDESRFYVELGSLWQREDDEVSGSYTGADVHLDGEYGWVEVSEEDLREYFKEL